MTDRRTALIDAGIDILRQEGLAGFTQAKIAARVGLRQGHLTYYFPTRTDLLVAVASAAIELQMEAISRMIDRISSVDQVADLVAAMASNHASTRVLVALNQAADNEPELQGLFNKLADGFVSRITDLLTKLGLDVSEDCADLVHALFVGLAVIDLATSRQRSEERIAGVFSTVLRLLIQDKEESKRPSRRKLHG
ncbi:TPA: TetR/AcrR family transcriptional regulator [Pseudomonas aeruginosa]